MDLLGPQGAQVPQDPVVIVVILGHLDPQDVLVVQVPLGLLVLLVAEATLVLLDPGEIPETEAPLEDLGEREQLVCYFFCVKTLNEIQSMQMQHRSIRLEFSTASLEF